MKSPEDEYPVVTSVYDEAITATEGARILHEKFGKNLNSAKDLIAAYKGLRDGRVFRRTLSQADMEFYLAKIYSELGTSALAKALHALRLHIDYYKRTHNGRSSLARVAAKYEEIARGEGALQQIAAEFKGAVRRSLADTSIRRRERLRSAPKTPRRIPITLMAFVRNPDVVAEVTTRAAGTCERCKKKAPFLRSRDGTPYLEVHHKVQLADGGEDTVENAEALCPNCHREKHFGGAPRLPTE